jgi:hypothetical protein
MPGDKKARWCLNCPDKPKEAINIVSERCACGLAQPSFGLPGQSRAKWCKSCPEKPENSVNVKCKKCACGRTQPYLGLPGDKARWCKNCPDKPEEARYVQGKFCLVENCYTRVGDKYRGYCAPCFALAFPEEPIARSYKTKEREVVQSIKNFFEKKYPHVGLTFDRQVDGGCSARRPDIRLELFTHTLIVEVDEDRHDTEEYCSCENKRMMQLMQDLGMRPIVFLRQTSAQSFPFVEFK